MRAAIATRPLRIAAVCALAFARACLPARRWASEPIDSFTTTTSTTQAGGHPDLTTSFTLENPARRGRQERDLQRARRASSATPTRSPQCTAADFALDAVPVRLPGRADHRPRQLRRQPQLPARHGADLRRRTPGGDRRRASPSSCPSSTSRSTIPVAVRTGDPTTACASRSPTSPRSTPLAGAKLTFWGFPADSSPRRRTLPQRLTRQPGRLPGTRRHQLHLPRRPHRASPSIR